MDCHKCTYYYVTWDQSFPNGCRGMGFKSRRYPINEVRRVMDGKDCLFFTRKPTQQFQSRKISRLKSAKNPSIF